jgi:hypothetical protein
MKFVLVLQICSALLGTCENTYRPAITFDTFHDCGIGGYSIAGSKMKELDSNLVNKEKLYVKFGCVEVKLEEENA